MRLTQTLAVLATTLLAADIASAGPLGIGGGPKPGFEDLPTRTFQDAYGFMIDTRTLLRPTTQAKAASEADYTRTYLSDAPRA